MKKYYLALHLAVLLAGFTGVFGKLITLNKGLLTGYRVLFSALWLLLALKCLNIKIVMTARQKLQIAATGMLLTLHWLFFYGSIKYANVSVGVVCYSLTSFFTAVFTPLINRKRPVLSELLLSGLTLLGIALLFHFDAAYQLGILLGIISSALAALYTLYNERLVKQHDSIPINYYQMIGGTLGLGLLMPFYLHYFPAPRLLPDPGDTVYLVLLSLFCTVGLYILFAESLKRIPAFTVNLSFNLEPVYAILIAFLFFAEGKEVNSSFYVGLFLVAASVILQTLLSLHREKRARRDKPAQQAMDRATRG